MTNKNLKYFLLVIFIAIPIYSIAYSPIPCGYIMKRGRIFFNMGSQMRGVKGVSHRFFRTLKSEHNIPYNLYGVDNNSAYYAGKKIEGADPKTFKVIGGIEGCGMSVDGYSIDKNFVYYCGRKIENADIDTFNHLSLGIAKDKNHVYVNGEKEELVDSYTFHFREMRRQRDWDIAIFKDQNGLYAMKRDGYKIRKITEKELLENEF